MKKKAILKVNPDKCKGCLTCQLICTLVKEGVCNPERSRIRVSTEPKQITFKECDGCFICARFCAFGALEVGS